MTDAERVRVKCRCGATLKVPPAALGRKARCPKCHNVTVLRADQPAAAQPARPQPAATKPAPTNQPAPPGDRRLTISCSCGARLKVPARAIGHRVKCPKCGGAVAVPKPTKSTAAKPAAPGSNGDDLLEVLGSGRAVAASAAQRAAMQSSGGRGGAVYGVAAATSEAPPEDEEQEEHAAGPPITCPSCRKEYPADAKICPACGINLKTGRALITTEESNLDQAYMYAENILRPLSWLIFTGLHPFASEAFGVRTPWGTRGIAVVTVLVSIWYFFAVIYNPDPSPSNEDLMLWCGQGQSGMQDPNEAWAEFAERLRDQGMSEESIDSLREMDYFEMTPRYRGEHRPYQLVTHMFLHGGVLHLAGNMLFLMVFGARVNALIGNTLTIILYLVLGIAAGLAQMASMSDDPLTPSLGASGAVMGLIGMYLVFFPLHKVHMVFWWRWGLVGGFRLNMKMFAIRGFWVVLFYCVAFDVLFTVLDLETGVAHWAHLGGFLTGAGFALLLLMTRVVNANGGDIVSTVLGRHAWALVGKPGGRGVRLW